MKKAKPVVLVTGLGGRIGSAVAQALDGDYTLVGFELRYANALFGAWLVAAPWLLEGYSASGTFASLAAGILLIALASPRGAIRNHYGTWDRWIR